MVDTFVSTIILSLQFSKVVHFGLYYWGNQRNADCNPQKQRYFFREMT